MSEGFYITLGFALIFISAREEHEGNIRESWIFSFKLSLALAILMAIDALSYFFLWNPMGRSDFRIVSLFLWTLLIDEGIRRIGMKKGEETPSRLFISRSFLALLGFSLWMIAEKENSPIASWKRIGRGLGLPLGTGFFEWLLEGLRRRLRLASVPRVLEGAPILFWLAMLLFLAFWGFQEAWSASVNL